MDRLSDFEKIIGYEFKNKALLFEALSHSSFANESKEKLKSNERLEFLGDSVLSIVVSDYLFANYKDLPEGELTKTRATLVCEKTLHSFAKTINLGSYIMLGKGEIATGGNERPSIIADAFEAVIAAIYLDGGLDAARAHILKFLPKDVKGAVAKAYDDYKTILQEIIQKNPEEKVEYVLVSESGPDHNKSFTVQVRLNSNVIGEGTARSKKQAEQLAAKETLKLMGCLKDE
ncbi:MAG: ribonuclease III [Oscillospiraceae bacterium]|nr:ribonuclease III [Oscillospiraceae bacterium]